LSLTRGTRRESVQQCLGTARENHVIRQHFDTFEKLPTIDFFDFECSVDQHS
jgi:hypothetical protein